MFNVGPEKLMVVLLVALIVLGPDKLPNAARQIGRYMNDFRRISQGFQQELRSAMDMAADPVTTATAVVASPTPDDDDGDDQGAEAQAEPEPEPDPSVEVAPEPERGPEPTVAVAPEPEPEPEIDAVAKTEEPPAPRPFELDPNRTASA